MLPELVNREATLQQINVQLSERSLKPLRKLGDASKGEIEIECVKEVYDHSKRFFTDVKFGVKFPNGSPGEFTVRFAANNKDGAVIVALVNGKFALVEQWRLPLGVWVTEVPRGFGEKLDAAQIAGGLGTLKIGDLPLGTLARELGEEVMGSAEVTSVTHLGNVAENSGTNAIAPSYFLVQLRVPEDKLAEKLVGSEELQDIKVQLWDAAKVKSELGRKLCDNHTITALSLALNYIETLPRV